jgi:hypothetical protein
VDALKQFANPAAYYSLLQLSVLLFITCLLENLFHVYWHIYHSKENRFAPSLQHKVSLSPLSELWTLLRELYNSYPPPPPCIHNSFDSPTHPLSSTMHETKYHIIDDRAVYRTKRRVNKGQDTERRPSARYFEHYNQSYCSKCRS